MRLATWNCQTGLDSNWGFVEELAADVLTIQECGASTPEQATERGWACEWQPGGWDKGLAVLARSPYRIESRESPEPFFISTVIAGPERFRFVGFWAMTPSYAKFEYPQQATHLIEYLPDDGLATVIAGDFNASKSSHHLRNVATLRTRGLVSVYHAFHGVQHDATEVHPTSYHHSDRSHPFHMDFVFVPSQWQIESVHVGSYEDYPGRHVSDHVPVLATIHPD